ncbi:MULTISPECIES: hypothetical protein [Deinococcus]|uniref:Uncharacterized protein n=1 Tax=Deinococcus rufus TaxID=2136097 RepID=A0ABV7ZC01_9DEIO|nr:hypothetical protein [Deinococcus sp. AB2017081]WQE97346.1 hypothetical protein U2P90_19770 [Deinococcus sp. AB2017081]
MREDSVPLSEVLMALPVHEGAGLMRALRLGATVTCVQRHRPDGLRFVLYGQGTTGVVRTREHRRLGSDLVADLMARLEPQLHRHCPPGG